VPAQERLHIRATSAGYWFQVRDRLAATNDCVVLATVLNTVEQISEVAGRIGRSDVRHAIRLSDSGQR